MTAESFSVEAKTWLPRSTYKAIYAMAREQGTTIDALLASIAERAVTEPTSKRRYARMTPELLERGRALRARGVPDVRIAAELGVSSRTLYTHRAQLRSEQ